MELSISPGRSLIVTLRAHGRLGVRELPAMLDTGASVMTISPTDATELGYDVGGAPASNIITASGRGGAPRLRLSRIEIGESVLEDVPALCVDVSPVGVSCLLGLSALSHLNVSIDHKSQTLTITDP